MAQKSRGSADKWNMRIAFFIDGVFLPERDGASARFARLPAAICHSGIGVRVFHAFRGWSQLDRIAQEPYPTYFFRPESYYNNLDLLVSLVSRDQIDIVQMNDLELVLNVGIPLAKATGVKLVFEAIYHSSTLARQLGLPGAKQRVLESLEREVADSVDHVITLSEPDRKRWVDTSKIESDRVSIVPFGVDCAVSHPGHVWVGKPSVVFIGNGYFEPNRRAVERIVADIWPALRSREPNASCLIVGNMPPQVQSACLNVGIALTGEVAEPSTFLRTGGVGIAPVSEGTGIRVKLLHYLAAGLPAVATSAAAEGLAFPALRIEDRFSSYADVIEDLVAEAGRVAHLILKSQDLLRREYAWSHIAHIAKDVYERVLLRPTRARAASSTRTHSAPMWLEESIRSGRFAGSNDLAEVAYRYGVANGGRVNLY